MRLLLIAIASGFLAHADVPAPTLWTDLQVKRIALKNFRQHFEVVTSTRNNHDQRSSKHKLVVEYLEGKWRERFPQTWAGHDRIFDGTYILTLDEDAHEYTRKKAKLDQGDDWPSPYCSCDAVWEKLIETKRQPCGFAERDDTCVFATAPMRKGFRAGGTGRTIEGIISFVADLDTGLILKFQRSEHVETKNAAYISDIELDGTSVEYRTAASESFLVTTGHWTEVKAFKPWDAKRIQKVFLGQALPELKGIDLNGKPFSLAEFKGKTVLIDLWATWCPPCRADSPALNKLQAKYGDRELVILGISAGEERKTVEEFLKEHHAAYRIALSAEMELPSPYEVTTIPTYIVVDPDGKVTAATSGDQGFNQLKKMLKKAGLDVD